MAVKKHKTSMAMNRAGALFLKRRKGITKAVKIIQDINRPPIKAVFGAGIPKDSPTALGTSVMSISWGALAKLKKLENRLKKRRKVKVTLAPDRIGDINPLGFKALS